MSDRADDAIYRIKQLQQLFSVSLIQSVDELGQFLLTIDHLSSPSHKSNQLALKNIHDFAHKLAGSAGTFQFPEVSSAAKELEYFCARLIEQDSKTFVASNWHFQLQQLLDVIKRCAVNKESFNQIHKTTLNHNTLSSNRHQIVLVDDDELLSALIQEQVKHFGFNIHCIHDPEELPSFLEQNSVDVILMDIMFPDCCINGIDLIKQLKANNKIHCPVIFLSNKEDFAARLEAMRSGGDGYIVKPVNILELIETLDKFSDKKGDNKYRALIINDNDDTVDLYEKLLQKNNFVCKSIDDPFLVIEYLTRFLPDIVLLGVYLPGCSGSELAQVIRQDNRFTHIPILFLSADNNQAYTLSILNSAGHWPVDKKTNQETFVSTIINQSRQSRLLHAVINRLRKDELLFQAINHASSDAIITLNQNGLIILWNEGAERIFGYQAIEVIGHSIELIIPEKHRKQHHRGFNNLVNGDNSTIKKTFEIQAKTKDGELISIELSYSEWMLGNERFFISIVRDITERKAMENQLIQQQENLDAIIANSAEGIITIDQKGIIEMINPKAAEIFAYGIEELQGKNISILIPEGIRHQHDKYIEQSQIYASKIINNARELQGLRKDGSLFPMELNVAPMYIGRKKKYVGILHDITERKNALTEIADEKREAELANQAKSLFLSSMSHELRTPLNAVIGFSQILKEDETLNEDQLDSLEHIHTAGKVLLELIDEVLDLSKVESGQANINVEVIDLAKSIKNALFLITPQLKNNITLQHQLPSDDSIFIEADPVRFTQILTNLLTNAIKYNRENGYINVFTKQTKNRVRIFVKDTGYGIAKEKLKDLFVPFNRLGANYSNIEGTGIGLTITKTLVEIMGGEIGLDNRPDKGCTFWVEFDKSDFADDHEKNRQGLDTENILNRPACVNILYIEDNKANRLLMKKIIEKNISFQYHEAVNGNEGIQTALELEPEIILLDINLPDISGFEVYQQLKQYKLTPASKVIFISANAMPTDIDKAQNIDYFDYVTKPIEQHSLLETINRALKS